jgi:hypothetical protein
MNLLKFINIPVFIVSLAFGIFAVYITAPTQRKIIVYPTPENVQVLQFRDKTNTCFSPKQTQVTCPKNESEIARMPIQS